MKRLEIAELHGKITASREPGRRVLYSRRQIERLRAILSSHGIGPEAATIHFGFVALDWQARREGLIRHSEAARLLKVDEGQLRRLCESGEIEYKRVAHGSHGAVLLHRSSLAAYCFTRPRCAVCQRRVIGSSGCNRHRLHARERSEETRRKIAAARLSGPLVQKKCEWCDSEFELLPSVARTTPGRFCSVDCQLEWLHDGPDGAARLQKMFDGQDRFEQLWASAQSDGQLTIEALSARLPRGLRRAPSTLRRHAAEDWLTPTSNKFGRYLFSLAAVEAYISWLRDHPSERVKRFTRGRFRKRWTLGRRAGDLFRAGYSTAEAGRELGYTADYIAKLWRRREVTPEIQTARQRRRVLARIPTPGACEDFRTLYRALHISAAEAEPIVWDLELSGAVKCERDGRRVIVRRVSQIPD